ncbi:MAG TPA: nickel pincer cofactor biosynthesis protein LarC [Spirochaetota bacterium]|jgi:hypothetical protein|nr:MAG: hypothetical protein BWX91_00531 [Spirochaetes bacterium ADurb.Bin133]HNZ26486.1 nickel pincer cofactor biosynthesis protein LarC [Spirochaetota bacterium]HPY87139.1 nickel pincer cofactor biosynthesis protein LarC [Spirochaetota bacterium]HQB60541.1 nickel pincer cofactor biosynthesis protein LarC [Spirochaetota bacterium]
MDKVLYLDSFSGVSGDKFVGALLSLGGKPSEEYLKTKLQTLSIIDEFEVNILNKKISGIECLKFDVITKDECKNAGAYAPSETKLDDNKEAHMRRHHKTDDRDHKHSRSHSHRGLSEINDIILKSSISDRAKKYATDIFRIIGEAEAKVHDADIESVHFHEVGAVDSIVDIVSASILVDYFDFEEIISSPIPLGKGFIRAAHGVLPVPAPATALLIANVPAYAGEVEGELTTPTGAALVKYFSDRFEELNNFEITKVGYGAGTKDFAIPNFLRVYLGKNNSSKITVVETNIDDSIPEELGYLSEKLFEIGALDVYQTPIYMKKGRIGVKLSVITERASLEKVEEAILKYSPTFGLRKYNVERKILDREIRTVDFNGEVVRIKDGRYKGVPVKSSFEYEDVKKLMTKMNKSYNEIIGLLAREFLI